MLLRAWRNTPEHLEWTKPVALACSLPYQVNFNTKGVTGQNFLDDENFFTGGGNFSKRQKNSGRAREFQKISTRDVHVKTSKKFFTSIIKFRVDSMQIFFRKKSAAVFFCSRKFFCPKLFFPAEFSKLQPQRPRDKNWRVTAAHEADNQRERKIFCRLAAEEKQRKRREQASEHRINRARQSLINRTVDKLDDISAAPEVQF